MQHNTGTEACFFVRQDTRAVAAVFCVLLLWPQILARGSAGKNANPTV